MVLNKLSHSVMVPELRNHSGMSLVETMIVMVIMGIITYGMMTMLDNQNRETRALGERLASFDYTRVITSTLSNPALCNALFLQSNVVGGTSSLANLDLTNAATTPVAIGLNALAGVAVGAQISAESKNALIDSSDGLQLLVTSMTTAKVVVKLDSTKLVRAIPNMSFPITLATTGTINSATISGCAAASGGGVGEGQTWQNMTGSRANGGTYTNSTGKPIMVAVSGTCGGSSGAWFYVNGQNVGFGQAQWNGCGAFAFTGPWLVPDGATYAATVANGLSMWWELR